MRESHGFFIGAIFPAVQNELVKQTTKCFVDLRIASVSLSYRLNSHPTATDFLSFSVAVRSNLRPFRPLRKYPPKAESAQVKQLSGN